MTDPFDEPGSLDSLKWADYDGRLVLITPQEIKHDVPNLDGTGVRDVVFGDIVVLDGPGAPEVFKGTPIYPRYLQGQVRANIGTGRSNLGRVGKDASRQQRGQSAPWVLGAPNDADKKAAREFLAGQASRPSVASSTNPTGVAGSTTFSTDPPF